MPNSISLFPATTVGSYKQVFLVIFGVDLTNLAHINQVISGFRQPVDFAALVN